MSRIIIYLGLSSPKASSDLPENRPGKPVVFIWSCFGWGLHGYGCYQSHGSLLHCLSTLTVSGRTLKGTPVSQSCYSSSAQRSAGGLFLLHLPWSRLHRTLSGILPCEARTFLSRKSSRDYLSYLFPCNCNTKRYTCQEQHRIVFSVALLSGSSTLLAYLSSKTNPSAEITASSTSFPVSLQLLASGPCPPTKMW